MKRRLPWILFVLSLILNVALIGGAIYVKTVAHHYRDNPDARAEYLAEELELDQGQEQELIGLIRELDQAKEERRDDRKDFRDRFMAMLAQPDLSREDVIREMESGTGDWLERFADKTLRIHGFVQTLTPEQREELFALARERRGGITRLFSDRN